MDFTEEISGDIGKRILQVRENESLNQEDFARKLGLTKSAISGYETGRRTPTKVTLKSIAQMFSYNEIWLFSGNGEPKSSEIYDELHTVYSHFHCSEFERDFLDKYFGMPEKDRHLFCYYMNYLFGSDSRNISPESDLIHGALQKITDETPELNQDIEAEVEAYRQRLIEEKKQVSPTSAAKERDAG